MKAGIWVYPWDLLDEGAPEVFERLSGAGLQVASVAAAYHSVRALCPHNPRRAVYHGEGGVAYFRPNMDRFAETPIKPVVSQLAAETDPLRDACKAAARSGVKVHAWTVLNHNTRLASSHPECAAVNAFGDVYPFGLCPANPAVREYARAMVRSLFEVEALEAVELEALGYQGMDHSGHHAKQGIEVDPLHRFLLSICFCEHCRTAIASHGADPEEVAGAVRAEMTAYFGGRFSAPEDALSALGDILGDEEAEAVLAARDEVVLTLLEDLYWLAEKPRKLIVYVSASPLATGAATGVTISEARQWADALLVQTASKEASAIRAAVADVAVRRGATPVVAGLQAIAPFVRSPAELAKHARAAAEAGAEGLQFYHYGLMPLGNLAWIGEAIRATL